MQLLGGLENVIVRQLPVSLHLINDFTENLSMCNKSDALELNVSSAVIGLRWCLISSTNEKLTLMHSNGMERSDEE